MLGPAKACDLDRFVLIAIEPYVPKGHFYRYLYDLLDLSFVRDLVADRYAVGGRPSIDPEVFFRLQLAMFFEGIRSERKSRTSGRWRARRASGPTCRCPIGNTSAPRPMPVHLRCRARRLCLPARNAVAPVSAGTESGEGGIPGEDDDLQYLPAQSCPVSSLVAHFFASRLRWLPCSMGESPGKGLLVVFASIIPP